MNSPTITRTEGTKARECLLCETATGATRAESKLSFVSLSSHSHTLNVPCSCGKRRGETLGVCVHACVWSQQSCGSRVLGLILFADGDCACSRSQTRGGFPPGPRSYSRRLTPGLDGRRGGGKKKRPRRCGHTRAVSTCTVVFACCACDTGAPETLGVCARLCVWSQQSCVCPGLHSAWAAKGELEHALRPHFAVQHLVSGRVGPEYSVFLPPYREKHADYGTLSFGVSGVPHTERDRLTVSLEGRIPHLPAYASRGLDLKGCE